MAPRGAKPKPPGQIRHRNPTLEWTEVPDRPFDGAPPLPKLPPKPRRPEAPAPDRPLGPAGLEFWRLAWGRVAERGDEALDGLLQLCELMDERMALRIKVLREGDWRARNALRALDGQILGGRDRLGLLGKGDVPRPAVWPAATKRWWRAISAQPHCILWSDADWQYAQDTALVAAAFHAGDLRLAAELRAREKVLGTTADARRDLRIRLVPVDGPPEEEAEGSVTAMAAYRKMVGR